MASKDKDRLADDLLEGGEAIAEFLYGDRKFRRKVFYLAERPRTGDRLPTFKIGATVCARKSTLMAWIAEREKGASSTR